MDRNFEHRMRAGVPGLQRKIQGLAIAAGAMLFCAMAADASAEDVGYSYQTQNGSLQGTVAIDSAGHFHIHGNTVGGPIDIDGDIEGPVVTVNLTGALALTAGLVRNDSATATEIIEAKNVEMNFTINPQNPVQATLRLTMPDSIVNPKPMAPARAADRIDPIQRTFVVRSETEVQSGYEGTPVPMGTLKQDDQIYVVGKVEGKPWYQVNHNGQFGFVPESDIASPDGTPPVVTASAAAAPASTASASPLSASADLGSLDFGRYVAVVIGNNTYRNGISSLKTAVNDATAIAQALQREYGFKVVLLTNATREQMFQALTRMRLSLTWDDNLLIYYAGHGAYDHTTQEGYWLPVDSVPQDPSNWISNSEITNMLRAFRARHVMVVADSCYSGSLTRDANVEIRDANYLTRIVQKKARTVMTSGGLEPVSDKGTGGHSIFAAAFLATLQANTGIMDAETFFEDIRRPVILAATQTPEYTNLGSAGHDGGDFVFVRKP
jgi:hypothetical protein